MEKIKSNYASSRTTSLPNHAANEISTTNNDLISTSTKTPNSVNPTVTTSSTKSNNGLKNCTINANYSTTSGLTHYWGFYRNYNDSIGGAHLFGGQNHNLTFNRFNSSFSALSLRNGFLNIPSVVHFNSSLTFLAWVYAREFRHWARIVECGNGADNDNVEFVYSREKTGKPALVIINPTWHILTSAKTLTLNKWQHLAFVLDHPKAYIFIDGNLISSSNNFGLPRNVFRKQCYVGKSLWGSQDELANADFDEIKIFKRALTKQEILFEMNNDFCL